MDEDDPVRIGGGGKLQAFFQGYADRNYDAETDKRMIGGDGYQAITCELCEDEGVVYFTHVDQQGFRYWFMARCDCHAGFLPRTYRAKVGKDAYESVTDIPRWCDIQKKDGFSLLLKREDILPTRLQPYAHETGILPFPLPEPLHVKYRKIPDVDHEATARRENQIRADNATGRRKDDDA